MSFKLMAQALDIKTGSSTTKLVLLKLCDNANDQGICWPSQDLIAEQCEMSKRTVVSSIKSLEVLGLLSIEKKCKNANKYLINLNSAKSAPLDPVVQNLHPSSANAALPYIEPIKEPIIKNIEKREEDFKGLVKATWSEMGAESFLPNVEAQKFFLYWSESNGKKMLFERQKTFDIKKRFKRWQLNNFNSSKPKGRNNA
mgnify:CR=1 FL=1|tara:strand:+ start:50 stop:646 length:597 start_codon:yes stop_codon:yes gene_type:complete